MRTSLTPQATRPILARLRKAQAVFVRHYPGESGRRQPIHTVYGGAHLFRRDAAQRLGAAALRSLEQFAPDWTTLADVLGLSDRTELARTLYDRVVRKLERDPVEDFRIDFEDGFGVRPDPEEDEHALRTAEEVAAGMASGTLPPFLGIRLKALSAEMQHRSIRTLDLFLTALTGRTRRQLPPNFVVTLPKVSFPEQVAALSDLCDLLEKRLRLPCASLKLELMMETPQAILNHRGECALPGLVAAARGRCVAAHFGTYDYTAACTITAAHQHMTHPACDFARDVMQVALAGTGIWLSDGATNILPVPPHQSAGGQRLTPDQAEENRRVVHAAWKLHFDHIRYSLVRGYYQGWDLHPAQLPTRYAAVYSFFLEGLPAASERLRNFVEKAGQATLVGEVFDDAATGQGLLNYFLRALSCGAITEQEALATGLTREEFGLRSFVKILEKRRR